MDDCSSSIIQQEATVGNRRRNVLPIPIFFLKKQRFLFCKKKHSKKVEAHERSMDGRIPHPHACIGATRVTSAILFAVRPQPWCCVCVARLLSLLFLETAKWRREKGLDVTLTHRRN